MATSCDLVVTCWSARFQGLSFPVATGRGGIGRKSGEGDGVTPLGTYNIVQVLARNDRLRARSEPIRPHMGWSDDPGDPDYNALIYRHRSAFSHEVLMRPDPLYDLIAVLDFNIAPTKAGAGSAIFLHCWRRPRYPTEGCIAFAPHHLAFILENWSERSRVLVR